MCFSAEASFASGVVLSTIGVASLKTVGRPEQRLFAFIPLLFALQQFSEGVVWATLKSGGYERLQNAAAHLFLVAALVVWPVVVPLAIRYMEETRKRKIVLSGLLTAGIAVSLFYAFCLVYYQVTPRINSFHIQYVDNFPVQLVQVAFLFYVASCVAPLFVSSVRHMWLFGVLIAASAAVSSLFYSQYLTSVWCFFAALISGSVYFILVKFRQKAHLSVVELQP